VHRVGVSINAIQRDISLQVVSDITKLEGANHFILPSTEAHTIPGLLNLRVMQAKEEKCSHVLFLDFDTEIPPDGLKRLLSRKLPIVSGLYHLRRYPFSPVGGWLKREGKRIRLVNRKGDSYGAYYLPIGAGLVEVDWTGVGCLLVSMEVFSKLRKPFPGLVDGLGHDINFCIQAKAAGYRLYLDNEVSCGHWTPVSVDRLYAESYHDSGMAEHYQNQLMARGDNRFSHAFELAGFELAEEALNK